ncbi:hypothetical protein EC988_008198 [Linderina pennispora]|nr:hypothetical protein EC988_008198 [Linderina pennispora]
MVFIPDEPPRHSLDAARNSTPTTGTAAVQHAISEHGTNSTTPRAGTIGQQHRRTANRMSYAHQRSQSGWDKLFRNMSQRSESHPAEHTHSPAPDGDTESRVPGIGEDTLLHEDVQYVDE